MMEKANFTHFRNFGVQQLSRGFGMLLVIMVLFVNVAMAGISNPTITANPTQIIPGVPTPVQFTISWTQTATEYGEKITVNAPAGVVMTLGGPPAANGCAAGAGFGVSGSGSNSVTFGNLTAAATGTGCGPYNGTVTVTMTVTTPVGTPPVSFNATVVGDGWPINSPGTATSAAGAVIAPQTCIITPPAAVTVNTVPNGTSAIVTLPLATATVDCQGLTTFSNETFTGATTASLQAAGWTFSGVPAMTAAQIPNYFRVLAAAGAGGGALNPNIAGNRLVLDDDFIGGGFIGTGIAVSPVITVPAGAVSPKLLFDYRNGNATGDFLVDFSTDNGVTWTNIVTQAPAGVGCGEATLTPGVNIRIRVQYQDQGAWAWSGEIDNIRIVGLSGVPAVISNNFNAGLANASGLYSLGVTTVTYSVPATGCGSPVSASTQVTVVDPQNPNLNIPGNAGFTVTGPTGPIPSTGGTGTVADPFTYTYALGAGGCSANVSYTLPTYTDNVPNPPAAATFASVVPAQTAANLALLTPTFPNRPVSSFPAVAPNVPYPAGIMGGAAGTGAGFPTLFFGFQSAVAQPLGVTNLTNLIFADGNFAAIPPPATIQVFSRTDTNNPGLFMGSIAGWSGPVTATLSNGGISIQSIAITNPGGGYAVAPTVTITGGTPAIPATVVATINATGNVTGITITHPGAGYVTAPTITISAPLASSCTVGAPITALATATLSPIRSATYALPTTQFVTPLGAISFAMSTDPLATAANLRFMYDAGTLNSANAAGTLLNGGAQLTAFSSAVLTPRLARVGLVFGQGSLENLTPQYPNTGFAATQGPANIVTWKGTDISGNMTTKAFSIKVTPSAAASSTLACNESVNITMDVNCNATVSATQMLKGGPYGCLGTYKTEVYNGTNLIGTTTFDPIKNCYGFNGIALSNYVGQTLIAKVYDVVNPNNSCWGNITLEDKLKPVITCPADLVVTDCTIDIATAPSVKSELTFPANNAATTFLTTNVDIPVTVSGLPATSLVESIKVKTSFTTTDWLSEVQIELVPSVGAPIILKQGGGSCTAAGTGTFTFEPGVPNGPFLGTTPCGPYTTWNNGSVLPFAPLTPAIGLPANGTWLVRFRDTGGVGVNTINANGVSVIIGTTVPIAGATAKDGCAGVLTPTLTTQVINLPCGNPLLKQIKRTFKATDNFGNTATCVQNVNYPRPTLASVVVPADRSLDCTYDNFIADPSNAAAKALLPAALAVPATYVGPWFDASGNPHPNVTGRPTGFGCSGIVIDYQDMRLSNLCGPGLGYTVMRTWKVYDACANALTTKAQQITVKDNTAPVIDAASLPVTAQRTWWVYSTDQASCNGVVTIKQPKTTDNCSSAAQLTYSAEVFLQGIVAGTPDLTKPVGLAVSGNAMQFTDIPMSPVVAGVPVPYIAVIRVSDACGNFTTANARFVVLDITAPVVVCPPTVKVTLTQDGSATLTGVELDRGSYDNCTTISRFEVRRMAPVSNCTGRDVNNDGDYEDYLLVANSNVSYPVGETYYNVEVLPPFTATQHVVQSPVAAMIRAGALILNDTWTNGILDRQILINGFNYLISPPPAVAYPQFPTLFILNFNAGTNTSTVQFNNAIFVLTFNAAGVLTNTRPTQIILPVVPATVPATFVTRNVKELSSYTVDPDLSDVYGDYNENGDPNDEDYYEYNYDNFYHPEVRFCCEDVGDTIMVALRAWDSSIYKNRTNNTNPNHTYYRVGYPATPFITGNVNICMTQVIVEDKIDPKILVQDTAVICGNNVAASAWFDAHGPVKGTANSNMSDNNVFANKAAVALDSGAVASVKIAVSGLKKVKDLNVGLQFYHTYIGNLIATVTSPSGKSAVLFSNPVDVKNSLPYESPSINSATKTFKLKFDDEPTLAVANAIGFQAIPGIPSVITAGTLNKLNTAYLATDALSIFDNENPNGEWTITIESADPFVNGTGAILASGAQLLIKADRNTMPQGFYYDNCGDATVTYTENGSIDNCGKGTVNRVYTVTDCAGRKATDTQSYTSVNRSAYTVLFPADVNLTCIDNSKNNLKPQGAGNVNSTTIPGSPVINTIGGTCPLVGVEYTDDTLTISNGGVSLDGTCFKILRTWKILNWCQGLNLNADKVQRITPTACITPEERTFVNIDYAAWPVAMNTAQVNAAVGECTVITYDEDGYMEYLQVIKVTDNAAPSIIKGNAGLVEVGKECRVKLTVSAPTATDCTGKVSTYYEIINASNVKVGGASTFPSSTFFGGTGEQAFGTYTVRWFASDNCGNLSSVDEVVVVKDAKKPTPICFNGLSVELMPTTGNVMVSCSLFDAGSYDNCQLDGCYIQIPAPGAGAPAPTAANVDNTTTGMTDKSTPNKLAKNALFNCTGTQTVALWVKDAAGNWDYCETYIEVQNNMGAPNVKDCGTVPPGAKIAAAIATETGKDVENVMVKLSGAASYQKPTTINGKTEFYGLGKTSNYSVKPELDKNPLNGVSTLDLVLMSKHILGVQPLNSAYQMIAADVNKSGTVSTADIVELRKMILAIQNNFSKNTSWRFVDKSYQFPASPLSAAFPESKQFNGLTNDIEDAQFVAVKVGDINGNAQTNGQAVGRGTVGTFFFNAEEQIFNAGQEVRATFKANEIANILGYQFTMNYNNSALDLITIDGNTENFGVVENGTITASWNGSAQADEQLFTLVFKAKKAGRLSELLNINSKLTVAEAYTKNAELLNVAINYNNATSKMELYQNQPNPFAGRTVIGFNLPKAENAKMTIYDMTGRILKVIEKDFAKGYNEVTIEDLNTTGVVKYTLSTATATATKSMIILE